MNILITAFAPFQGEEINATMEALALLPDSVHGHTLCKRILPVEFGKAVEAAVSLVEEVQPDAVVCLGQASGRADITPERVAINVMDARIADNGGWQPCDVPVRADGPAAYFSTLPVKAMVQAMKESGVPASLSNTAGTFVCNDVMYLVMHMLYKEFPQVHGGFIHVPFATMQNHPAQPSMPLSEIARGLELAVEAVAESS